MIKSIKFLMLLCIPSLLDAQEIQLIITQNRSQSHRDRPLIGSGRGRPDRSSSMAPGASSSGWQTARPKKDNWQTARPKKPGLSQTSGDLPSASTPRPAPANPATPVAPRRKDEGPAEIVKAISNLVGSVHSADPNDGAIGRYVSQIEATARLINPTDPQWKDFLPSLQGQLINQSFFLKLNPADQARMNVLIVKFGGQPVKPDLPQKPSPAEVGRRIKAVKDRKAAEEKRVSDRQGSETITFKPATEEDLAALLKEAKKLHQSKPALPQQPQQEVAPPLFATEYKQFHPETGKLVSKKEIELVNIDRDGQPVNNGDLFDLIIKNPTKDEVLVRIKQKIRGGDSGEYFVKQITPPSSDNIAPVNGVKKIFQMSGKHTITLSLKGLKREGEFKVELWPANSLPKEGGTSPRDQNKRTLTFYNIGEGVALGNVITIVDAQGQQVNYEVESWAGKANDQFPERLKPDSTEEIIKFAPAE